MKRQHDVQFTAAQRGTLAVRLTTGKEASLASVCNTDQLTCPRPPSLRVPYTPTPLCLRGFNTGCTDQSSTLMSQSDFCSHWIRRSCSGVWGWTWSSSAVVVEKFLKLFFNCDYLNPFSLWFLADRNSFLFSVSACLIQMILMNQMWCQSLSGVDLKDMWGRWCQLKQNSHQPRLLLWMYMSQSFM